MGASFAASLTAWHDFYLLVGTGAATLIGLMFVAVTFGATLIQPDTATASRAFLDPTVSHFVQVLVTGCLVVVPTIEPAAFGGVLIAMGLLRAIALVGVHRRFRAAHRKNNDLDLSDWMSGILVPLIVYLGLLGCGGAFVLGHAAFGALAAVTVVILLNGIYGAWELLLWLAIQRARAERT